MTAKVASVITTKTGEILVPNIVFDSKANNVGGFNVAGEFIPIEVFGKAKIGTIETKKKGTRSTLLEIGSDARSTFRDPIAGKSIVAVVFVQGPKFRNADKEIASYVNVRVPQPKDYWVAWNGVEKSGLTPDDIKQRKNEIKAEYPAIYNIEPYGARVLAPSETSGNTGVLLGLTGDAYVEVLFSRRSSRYPNTYRLQVENGTLYLIDPRVEARGGESVVSHISLT
jgi:hypothetical protein